MQSTVKIQTRGRVSIPANIRRALDAEDGDLVTITIHEAHGDEPEASDDAEVD